MAISRFGVGTVAAAASGNITPTLPASTAADDIAIIICAQADNVVSTLPAGWTIVDPTNNNGLNNERVWWAWKRLVGGDANPLITHAAGDSIIARIAVYRGVRTTGNPYDAKSVNASAGASTTVTGTAITPSAANAMIVFCGGQADNSAYSGYSGTNPTFSEAIDNLTTLGTDASIFLADGIRTTADSTGNRTATATRSFQNVGFMIALELPPSGITGNLGLITETDATFVLTRDKKRAIGLQAETDATFVVSPRKSASIALITEADATFALAGSAKSRTLGLNTESDVPFKLVTAQNVPIGLITEVSTALAMAANKARTLVQVVEATATFALGSAKARVLALVAETDAALATTPQKARTLTQITSVETLFAVNKAKSRLLNLLLESTLAQPLDQAGPVVLPRSLLWFLHRNRKR